MNDYYIRTYTGKKFNITNPEPEQVDIVDIAHALAGQNRFNGHTKDGYYNVAQHSWWVSKLCKPENALWGLLHDAAEAYVGDVVAPVKWAMADIYASMNHDNKEGFKSVFKELERRVQNAVCVAFHLSPWEPTDVKHADHVMVVTEGARFVNGGIAMGGLPKRQVSPANIDLTIWRPEVAERRFLARYEELRGARA